jgi:hypothetical protein
MKVELAKNNCGPAGVTKQTINGMSSYFCRVDKDTTVLEKLLDDELLKRIAKDSP